jgi:protein phosphatase
MTVSSAVLPRAAGRAIEALSDRLCCATDIGAVRPANEDAFRADLAARVFVLADGLGGHAAGEVAGRVAADVACAFAAPRLAARPLDAAEGMLLAADALYAADRAIFRQSADPGLSGMASALTIVFFSGDRLFAASLGDVRCYLRKDGVLKQLTRDQTPVGRMRDAGFISGEEARTHPERHFIDQAAGIPPVYPVCVCEPVEAAARILLCTDGLWGALPEAEIDRILSSEGSVRQIATHLLNTALHSDGRDNLSLILYDHRPGDAP